MNDKILIQKFNNEDEIHQIWNDDTYITYVTAINTLHTYTHELSKRKRNELFPHVPDYVVIAEKIYETNISSHTEIYQGKIDSATFFRINLTPISSDHFLTELLT